jgi:hypothetical protein
MTRFPQSAKPAQHVGKLLNPSENRLGKLMEHAAHLAELETMIRGLLSPDLAAQFQVATVRKNRLILVTPTASWATRLRMHAPQLIHTLQKAGVDGIKSINVRVAPLILNSMEQKTKRSLSTTAIQALDRMAKLRGDDSE